MASSTIYHARSISLPSRPHPVAEQFTSQLCRLRSSNTASTSSSSVICDLNGINDLYSCVEEFLQLPINQQALSQTNHLLDGSLRLLDICSASRDALQMSRERLQDIQSALRRRSSGELTVTNEAVEYLNTRRSVKKALKKCLKSLKAVTTAEQNDVNDVQEMTAETFRSLLSYIVGSQKSGWSVVGKLINKNSNKDVSIISEFDIVDATLNSLISQKKSGMNSSLIENLRTQSLKLESEIQDLDEVLECLFRHLVKTRATLLNIFSY
ncbi:hypothetical protein RND81_14G204500 [Saponaria officinalis]|uniref:Uncharacterized protein n=1 Tax=Saponaria officinalis TaxID=3572 RepID=A0AAW1GUH0_SAPOF